MRNEARVGVAPLSGRGQADTVASVWSLMKQGMVGSYLQEDARHLPAYLDEMEWRFHGRNNPYLLRDKMRALTHSANLR